MELIPIAFLDETPLIFRTTKLAETVKKCFHYGNSSMAEDDLQLNGKKTFEDLETNLKDFITMAYLEIYSTLCFYVI